MLNKGLAKQFSRHNFIGNLRGGVASIVSTANTTSNNDIVLTCGEDIDAGLLVGIGSDGLAYLFTNLDADDIEAVGISTQTATNGNSIIIKSLGLVTVALTGMTIGERVYARNGVVNLSQTALDDISVDEDLHICIGVASASNQVFVNICEKYRFE